MKHMYYRTVTVSEKFKILNVFQIVQMFIT